MSSHLRLYFFFSSHALYFFPFFVIFKLTSHSFYASSCWPFSLPIMHSPQLWHHQTTLWHHHDEISNSSYWFSVYEQHWAKWTHFTIAKIGYQITINLKFSRPSLVFYHRRMTFQVTFFIYWISFLQTWTEISVKFFWLHGN